MPAKPATPPPAPPARQPLHVISPPDFFHPLGPHVTFPLKTRLPARPQPRATVCRHSLWRAFSRPLALCDARDTPFLERACHGLLCLLLRERS